MSEHTKEPWVTGKWGDGSSGYGLTNVIAPDSEVIIATDVIEGEATRIIACVNACAGINPEAVPDMVEALKTARTALSENPFQGVPNTVSMDEAVATIDAALKKAGVE